MAGLPARGVTYLDAPIHWMGVFVMMPTDTHYLTVEDVAARFGVNVTTVYRLVKEGQLPAFKVGNQWRFREERLEEWVADRERVG